MVTFTFLKQYAIIEMREMKKNHLFTWDQFILGT